MRKEVLEYIDLFHLVDLSEGYRLNDFQCKISEYSIFLQEYALKFQDAGVSKTHLLINKTNADVVAYMALVTDSVRLSKAEKNEHEMGFIPFAAIPAIKIGQLAVDKKYCEEYRGIGSLMIELARGVAQEVIEKGVACKFVTVDADVAHDPTVVQFYGKNSFRLNEKYEPGKTVSMRLNIFQDYSQEEQEESTGTEG